MVDNGHLVQFSLQYRSVLRDCQEELDRRVEGEEDDDDTTDSLIQLSELMYKLELIWNLVEILLVEKNASKSGKHSRDEQNVFNIFIF